MHVSPLLVNSTDQIGIINLLEDSESFVQKLIGFTLLEEFPILKAIDSVNNAMILPLFVFFISINDF
jgi:hypothetical protein